MRTLYFDVDGTILRRGSYDPKRRLGDGALEAAVRSARFDRLVCVGDFAQVARTLEAMDMEYDGVGILFGICAGAFRDEAWFRDVTSLIDNPERRTDEIDLEADWWYVDDLAKEYVRASRREERLRAQKGRILVPDPYGDGQDVLQWLAQVGDREPRIV